MICNDIISLLDKKYPLHTAEDWDNSGFLVGRRDAEVKKIMVALDATDEVIDQAVKENVQLLITHHPLIFGSIKRVNTDDFIGNRIVKLIENGISYFAMHTNFDICAMADLNASQLELLDPQVLVYTDDEIGLGKVGILKEPMKYLDFAEFVKKTYELSDVRCYGAGNPDIRTVAVCSGSGKSLINDALMAGADVLVTGDVDYHTGIDAFAKGIRIIDAGHFGTEHDFISYVADDLRKELSGVEILEALQKAPYTLV